MRSVLHIVNRWSQGGVERFVEGLVGSRLSERLDQSILSVCTPVASNADCPKYGPLCGGDGMAAMARGAAGLGAFLREHPADIVHVHTNNSSGFLHAAAARRAGVPARVVHSHNASLGVGAGPAKETANVLLRLAFSGSETARLACSTEAGRHLFPGRDFLVVPNGVDVGRFSFDPAARREVRRGLGVGDGELLVGCVGSLVPAKNHMRALEIFAELRRALPAARLLILGEGPLRGDLGARAEALGVSGAVAMPGFVEGAHRWYSAMDVLLFPSLYEGLPVSLVEAQCSGLPVVCSDSVTREVALLGSFRRLPLSAPDEAWAQALLEGDRDVTGASTDVVRDSGFDRESTVRALAGVYGEAG